MRTALQHLVSHPMLVQCCKHPSLTGNRTHYLRKKDNQTPPCSSDIPTRTPICLKSPRYSNGESSICSTFSSHQLVVAYQKSIRIMAKHKLASLPFTQAYNLLAQEAPQFPSHSSSILTSFSNEPSLLNTFNNQLTTLFTPT